jgi:hypothetical protein
LWQEVKQIFYAAQSGLELSQRVLAFPQAYRLPPLAPGLQCGTPYPKAGQGAGHFEVPKHGLLMVKDIVSLRPQKTAASGMIVKLLEE